MPPFSDLTLADYRSLVKAFMAEDRTDDDNELFPDADIDSALNAAQVEVVRIIGSTLPYFRKTATIDLEAGNIDMPDDFLAGLTAVIMPSVAANPMDRRAVWFQSAEYMDQHFPAWRGMEAVDTPQYLVEQFESSGYSFVFYPVPTATVTNGALINYLVNPDIMEDDADVSPIMGRFPELQHTLLPFGALKILTLFEGGEADDQFKKFESLFMRDIKRLRMAINGLRVNKTRYGSGY